MYKLKPQVLQSLSLLLKVVFSCVSFFVFNKLIVKVNDEIEVLQTKTQLSVNLVALKNALLQTSLTRGADANKTIYRYLPSNYLNIISKKGEPQNGLRAKIRLGFQL